MENIKYYQLCVSYCWLILDTLSKQQRLWPRLDAAAQNLPKYDIGRVHSNTNNTNMNRVFLPLRCCGKTLSWMFCNWCIKVMLELRNSLSFIIPQNSHTISQSPSLPTVQIPLSIPYLSTTLITFTHTGMVFGCYQGKVKVHMNLGKGRLRSILLSWIREQILTVR